jgi:hypothetical protein
LAKVDSRNVWLNLGCIRTMISEFSEVLRKFGEFGAVHRAGVALGFHYLADLTNISAWPATMRGVGLLLATGCRRLVARPQRAASQEDKMMVPIPIMILASQLVIAVADEVPKFDIGRGCRVDSNAVFDPSLGKSGTIKRCMDDEQQAKDQLQTQWSGFTNSDRTMCVASTISDGSIPPSYVDLLTCLQDQQLARKLPKN